MRRILPARWLLGCGVLWLCATAGVRPLAADVAAGRQALSQGKWTEAEKAFQSAPAAEKGTALLGLAELYLLTGKYPEAIAEATRATQIPATKSTALCLLGETYRETGKTAEAIKQFQAALAAKPTELRARIYLGLTYQETGQEAQAEKALDQFFQDFNAGKIDPNRADQLTYTAMAARALQAWQDASDTFQSAVEKDPKFTLANLEWGELFLDKYNAQEASKCFADVLKLNPASPRALVGMARARLEASYDVKAATQLADKALQSNPRYVPALRLKARLALDDEQFAPAEALLRQALQINPADLETLALFATSRYLQDDRAGYETYRKRALQQNPRYSDFYVLLGELAVRHHRYAESTEIFRQALALNPKNAAALASLGTNLLRLGMAKEAEALQFVSQAFELDGFNVRTFNTLNLFEEVIAKDYETVRNADPAFIFRFNKKETPVLTRYVPGLMRQAWDGMVKKYGFTPKHPITVELFTERQHYGARTVGLPEFGAQGTCFGELITAMSPASAEASWELVLWHELAHVFHLQLSNNRVSRWFTEGLAEYETNVVRPYWRREHNRELYLSLRRGDLWKISELSSAFTRPDRPNGVTIAYHQSSLMIHYLVDTFGFDKIVQALKLYGQGKHDAEVLPAVTGKTLDQLDAGFREYLKKRYEHYEKGFLLDAEEFADGARLKAEAEKNPMNATAQARYAAALRENPEAAAAQARKALALDSREPLARYVLAEALLAAKDVNGAKSEFAQLLSQGVDGYAIRMALGRFAAAAGEVDAAVQHLNAAKRWDPDRVEPYALLMELYEEKERRAELLKEMEAYLDVQEHDHDAARLLVDRYALDKRWEDVARVASRLLSINPMPAFVHEQYGLALAQLNKSKEAAFELETALAVGLRKPGPVRGVLAKQYLRLGDREKARAAAEAALREDPGNPDAKEVLQQSQ